MSEDLREQLDRIEQELAQLTQSVNLLRETTDVAIRHLAAHVSHLALQIKIDQIDQQQKPEQQQ